MENLQLAKIANEVRKNVVTALHSAKSGHPGGSLSAADMLTFLYFEEMNGLDPKNPNKPDRDRFVLSKGHCAPALYSTLANRGYFNIEELKTLRHIDSRLQGHPDMKKIPGVDMTTGSLGQGLSAANGMAPSVMKEAPITKLDTLDPRSSFVNFFGKNWQASAIPIGGTIPPTIIAAMAM